MKTIALLNTEEILAAVKCRVLVSMTKANQKFFITASDDMLVLQTVAGLTVDSLCNATGTMIRDEFIDYDFNVDHGFKIAGVAMTHRNCIDQVLAELRVKECHAKADKRIALNDSKSLQDKINTKRKHDAIIRNIQNDYDTVSMVFWQLVDIIERS